MSRASPKQLTLPIVAERPAPGRPGGREIDQRNDTEYVEMTCRSILNWVQGARASDFYSVNPYRGCEFGCAYCYARYTHEFIESRDALRASADWESFERRIYVKVNAPEVLARELPKKKVLEFPIHFGSATDPYQPAERLFGLTRKLLERLLPFRGFEISIATKSGLIERDAELLGALARRHALTVMFSCVTMDLKLQRALEPRSHVPERRFQAMERLVSRGVRCGLLLAPVLPGIGDDVAALHAVCRRARDAGAATVASQVLFLPAASRRRFFPWLKEHHPELSAQYQAAYAGALDVERPERYDLMARVERAARSAGFPRLADRGGR